MRILLTGGSGQLGRELASRLQALGSVMQPNRAQLDLRRPGAASAYVAEHSPALIVNAAAYTNVDGAEQDPETAFAVNARGVGELAAAAAESGCPLIHFSTDYVFDGEADRPYRPDDEPRPINVYGESKLAGEQAIRGSEATALIIRTSWLFSEHRRNFVLAMLEKANRSEPIRVVNDQYGLPTSARELAEASVNIIRRRLATDSGGDGERPDLEVLHVGQGPQTTWHRLAQAVLDEVDDAPKLIPIHSSGYPTIAQRPRYSVLDCGGTIQRYGVQLPSWRESVREVVARARGLKSPMRTSA